MLGVTHALSAAAGWVVGCAALGAVGPQPSWATVAIGAGVAAYGSLIPDLDHPSSLATRSLWPATWLLSVLTRAISRAVYRATATAADSRSGDAGTHRGLTHTWPFAVAMGLLAAGGIAVAGVRWPAVAPWWWLGAPFGFGVLAHTLGDWCTRSGVPLLWPVVSRGRRWRRVGAPVRFSTGGPFERVVAPVVLAGVGFAALWLMLPAAVPASAPVAPAGVVVTPSPVKVR